MSSNANLFVTYHWDPQDNGLSPEVLGESIKGFGFVFREILKAAAVNEPVAVHVQVAKHGSIELGFFLDLLREVPFSSWKDLFDFYAFIGARELLHQAKEFAALHEDINAYFVKYPFDLTMIALAVPGLLAWARRQKKAPSAQDEKGKQIPKGYATKLHRLTKRGTYKKALRPFVDNQVEEVEIKTTGKYGSSTRIVTENFDQYLSEKEQILPDLQNGKNHRLVAQLVGLQKSNGEHLKFKLIKYSKPHNVLIAFPEEGKVTTDYVEFYGEQVLIEAQILRSSMYSKPKLKLLSIVLANAQLV